MSDLNPENTEIFEKLNNVNIIYFSFALADECKL